MNAITTTSTPVPPSYNDTAHAQRNEHLPTSELLSLQLEGESVFARGSDVILYKLTQAPLSGTGSILGVEEIVYKPSPPNSEEPRVNTRMLHLYDVKDFKWATVARSEHEAYGFEPLSGPTHCFSRGASLSKGKLVPCFGRIGSTWWWRDEKGNVIAVESVIDGSFVLELKIHLDQRMLNLLVTTWCAIIWHVNRERRELEVLKAPRKFEPTYSSPAAPKVRKPFGVLVPWELL